MFCVLQTGLVTSLVVKTNSSAIIPFVYQGWGVDLAGHCTGNYILR
jgi:hypothetical protein